jgi:hypothetical protein
MTERNPASAADFKSILEAALRARAEDPAAQKPGGPRITGPDIHDAIEQLLSSPAYVPVSRLAQMYAADQSGKLLEKARELDQFLADELCLSPELTTEDLKRLRREFAIYNHPDRVTSAERERATRRMTLVNVLIDKALKERKGEVTPGQ